MALWKDSNASAAPTGAPVGTPTPPPPPVSSAGVVNVTTSSRDTERQPAASPDAQRRHREMKESVVAADLSIEGKIEGAGHVRIAGKFKGDVHVEGNLTVDSGAHLTGQVHASTVVIGGEVNGNITAQRVDLLDTAIVNGDVKAAQLTVAAGSRMRGQVEFGWGDKGAPKRVNGEGTSGSGRA